MKSAIFCLCSGCYQDVFITAPQPNRLKARKDKRKGNINMTVENGITFFKEVAKIKASAGHSLLRAVASTLAAVLENRALVPPKGTKISSFLKNKKFKLLKLLVGKRGFEPPTPASRTLCSTRLSHFPIKIQPFRTFLETCQSQCHVAKGFSSTIVSSRPGPTDTIWIGVSVSSSTRLR
jgi:hypothetical protein